MWQRAFGRGLVETSGGLWRAGSIPVASRTARLAYRRVRRVGMGRQGAAKAVRDGRDLSSVLGRQRRAAEEGSAKRADGALQPRAHAGRDGARPGARRQRPAEAELRRHECLSVSARRHLGRARRLHLPGGRRRPRRRAPPAHSLLVHQAQRAASRRWPPSICPIAAPASCGGRRRTRRCRRWSCSTTRSTSRPTARWPRTSFAARRKPDAQVTRVFRLATRRAGARGAGAAACLLRRAAPAPCRGSSGGVRAAEERRDACSPAASSRAGWRRSPI